MAARAVRHGAHRSDPRQHQPGVSQRGARICAEQGALPRAHHGALFEKQRLPRDSQRSRAGARPPRRRAPARIAPLAPSQTRHCPWRRARPRARAKVRRLRAPRRPGAQAAPSRIVGRTRPRRSHQHPVHERHHRCAQGCNAVALQHRQQRALLRRRDGFHCERPVVHPGAPLPRVWHGARCAELRGERRDDGVPRREFRCRADDCRGGALPLHCAARRADDVHRDPRAPELGTARHEHAAHRHHGRRALPDRDDAPSGQPVAHEPDHDRLWNDRDKPDLVPVGCGRSARTPRLDRGSHPPACRSQDRRRRGPYHPCRPIGRTLHARLPGDAWLLGRRRTHTRSDRRIGLDAHRRPCDDRRAGLLQHRRPRQRHADSRR